MEFTKLKNKIIDLYKGHNNMEKFNLKFKIKLINNILNIKVKEKKRVKKEIIYFFPSSQTFYELSDNTWKFKEIIKFIGGYYDKEDKWVINELMLNKLFYLSLSLSDEAYFIDLL